MRAKERSRSSVAAFVAAHRPLLLFTVLFVAGVCAGVRLYGTLGETGRMLSQPAAVMQTFPDALRHLAASCLGGWVLLLLLYLAGLSPLGAPAAILVAVFYGAGVGLREAGHYAGGTGGVLAAAVLIVPSAVLCAAALLPGCVESVTMAATLGRQLFRGTARCGEAAQQFRLYSLRFLVLCGLILAAGAADTLLWWLYGVIGISP